MNTQPTPKTDAENDLQCELAAWELLKEARRERDEAREQWRMSSVCRELNDANERMGKKLAQTLDERDRLVEALQMITTFDYSDLQCDNGHGARFVATEALQSLTHKP
jgi:hypothetical protein